MSSYLVSSCLGLTSCDIEVGTTDDNVSQTPKAACAIGSAQEGATSMLQASRKTSEILPRIGRELPSSLVGLLASPEHSQDIVMTDPALPSLPACVRSSTTRI